jgi:hypothetical protein
MTKPRKKTSEERKPLARPEVPGATAPLARDWLRVNGYEDVAAMIDDVMDEWASAGKKTRRNWWEILAGDRHGNPRTIAGRKFPVLAVAQLRQGRDVTPGAVARRRSEKPPAVRVTGRWSDDLQAQASRQARAASLSILATWGSSPSLPARDAGRNPRPVKPPRCPKRIERGSRARRRCGRRGERGRVAEGGRAPSSGPELPNATP